MNAFKPPFSAVPRGALGLTVDIRDANNVEVVKVYLNDSRDRRVNPQRQAILDRIVEMLNRQQSEDPVRGDAIRALAGEQLAEDGAVEFDADSVVSESDDNGAYVQGWLWVDFAGTALDKTARSEEDEDVCRTCGGSGANGDDSYDGECPSCADKTDIAINPENHG